MFSNYGKTKDPFKRERDQIAYIQGLSSRLFYILNALPKGGSVVCCLDSRSWRKDFMEKYKESREDGEGNKGIMDNETKQIFYSLLAEFGEILKKAGIHSSKVIGAEGDDLLFKWAKYFNDKGQNCIIISGDRDLTQIVRGPEEPWNVVWDNKSNHNKLFSSPGWLDAIEQPTENTIFEFNPANKNDLPKLVRDSGASLQIMNTSHYLLHKILIGDDGDDVPSSWKVYKGEDKWVRVTDKKAEKIIEIITTPMSDRSLSSAEWLDVFLRTIDPKAVGMYSWDSTNLEKRMDEISGVLLRVMGDVDDAELRKKVADNILRNARLVWLRDEMLPFNINEMINENIKDSMEYTAGADGSKWNKISLLAGSRFGKTKVAPLGFDPFSLLDELPDEI
jgi:hypothetical protein